MVNYVSDSYTDAAWKLLLDHNPETGGPIIKHPTNGGNFYVVNSRAVCRSPGINYYSGPPASANYKVEADIVLFDASGSAGVVGRCNTGASTFYHAYFNVGNDELALVKWVAGSPTNIESVFGMNLMASSSGVTYKLTLDMNGTTIRVLVNGVQRISQPDSSITAIGRGGIRAGYISDTYTGKHFDNFRVYDDTSPAVTRATFAGIVG